MIKEMLPTAIEIVATGIEIIAVLVIVGGMVNAVVRYVYRRAIHATQYKPFKDRIGSSMLLGLEFLVAADVIRTVAYEPTLQGIALLGMLVLIRTFLSWSLVVEIEGRWPWNINNSQGD